MALDEKQDELIAKAARDAVEIMSAKRTAGMGQWEVIRREKQGECEESEESEERDKKEERDEGDQWNDCF